MPKNKNEGPEEEEIELPEGLDLIKGGGWGEKLTNWIKENFSSVILPIIALLILGGGIYLYSQNQAQVTPPVADDNATGTEIALDGQKGKEAKDTEDKKEKIEDQSEKQEEHEDKKQKEETDKDKVMGGPEEGYEVKASKGEGVTHLARQALKKYLTEKEGASDLSAEQKIYVEDYLQNKKGSQGLEVGDQLTFSNNSISEAVNASQNLTEAQLNNLTQYANQVPSLNY